MSLFSPEPLKPTTGATVAESPEKTEKAVFAAGCFWGVESTFRALKGVTFTQVGYTGGKMKNPDYRSVCTDETGHAEAVEVTYDPSKISYSKLLEVFWENHNPTTLNRQGPDFGSQYRSAIYYTGEAQHTEAIASRDALAKSGKWRNPIVTQILPAETFYRAEEYHQQYNEKRGKTHCGM
ncbi:MAG: peptide-methionine (S)-S-oxide reductase MsrA [Bacteroidota bacterium]